MAKKNILDDAKRVGFSHDSQVLYGMPAFWRIRDAVRGIWNNTKAEPNRERIPVQYRMVSRFKEELEREVISDNTFYTAKNLSSEDMRLDTYFNEVEPEIERYFEDGMDNSSIWHVSIDLCGSREGGYTDGFWKMNIMRDLAEKTTFTHMECEVMKTEEGSYTLEAVNNLYIFLYGKFEFKICYSICDWYEPIDWRMYGDLTTRELATYAEAACLYIALGNEQNKLKEEAELYGIPLEKETKPTKPEQQQQNKKQKTVDALTPEAKRIFDAAVEDGRFMKKTHTGYEWIFEDGSPTKLCFFLLEVYENQSPPWEQLQTLFARKEIFKTLSNQLKGRNWYREGKLGKWAKEIRDFVQSMKPTDEATPVKQKQPTTPTQTPPPVRQMTTEEAFNWMESLRPKSN